ncbi:MAG: hypothetical protein IJE43_23760 [Alphaproteobacteria bacterium]|nr:hypothetical protein [Alphaproteobacteria bacterium]
MKKMKALSVKMLSIVMAIVLVSCGDIVNTNYNSHFTEEGYFNDSTEITSSLAPLSRIKFYVEVSGSMNGFFRANKPTKFKKDVWEICSYYESISSNVTILTNNGSKGANLPMAQFQTKMNTGAFISAASTKVPVMLNSILSSLDTDNGEVAVLISDMKYSPVGSAAPNVLITQYSTDISKILGNFGKSVCLVCATSDYLDRTGNVKTKRSPYYFFIMGNSNAVAEVRDGISTLLKGNDSFVDNIESGFDYGHPKYSFGIPNKCYQLDDEPTFLQYEEADEVDTCTIKLKVDLKPYRWLMTDKKYLKEAFKIKPLYGSTIEIGNIDMEVKNITDTKLQRTAIATIELKLSNMPTDSEVLEWTLELPNTDYTLFSEFCGSTDENDYTKSYSIEAFMKGIFYGGLVNKTLESNYILVSKNY